MENVDGLDSIVDNVLSAAQQVRYVISFRTHTEDVLQAFWRLQDVTHRLLAHVADGDVDCSVLSRDSPNLIPSIVDVLGHARKSARMQIPAVNQACSAINELLLELQRIKHERKLARGTCSN